jgi:DNA replication protein DnaC
LPAPQAFRQQIRAQRAGTIAGPREDDSEHQKQISRNLKLLSADLGRRYAADRVTLENFEIYHGSQRPVISQLERFREGLKAGNKEIGNLIFFGSAGVGKDHLLASLLYSAVHRGITARWISGAELFGKLRDAIDSRKSEADTLREFAEANILAISDPCPEVGELSAWNVTQLTRLVDRRYRAMQATWLAMNCTDGAEAESRLTVPLFDRLRDSATVVRCFWPSYRQRRTA